jgi:hypothetical protein
MTLIAIAHFFVDVDDFPCPCFWLADRWTVQKAEDSSGNRVISNNDNVRFLNIYSSSFYSYRPFDRFTSNQPRDLYSIKAS